MDRVVVAGCAGSGKSTLAGELAERTGLPLFERDALGVLGSQEYCSAISHMAAASRWVLDGAPYYADELVYGAADTVIFLDYPKLVVMCRVLRRTLMIELTGRPSGAHRRQGLVAWRDPEHSVRWAWISHRDRHLEGLALTARPELRNAQIIRFYQAGHGQAVAQPVVTALTRRRRLRTAGKYSNRDARPLACAIADTVG